MKDHVKLHGMTLLTKDTLIVSALGHFEGTLLWMCIDGNTQELG